MKIPGKIVLLITALILLLPLSAYAEENEATTAYAPGINVYLSNAETGSRNANPVGITTVHARVLYEGCMAGEEYVLALQLEDSASGAICVLADGTGSLKQSFTAEGNAGIFEFEFEIDTSRHSGRTLAEIHYIEDYEAAYSKSSDENSGRIYVPEISTDAVSEGGEKYVAAGRETVICDVVTYYGLAPGEEYRLVTGLKDTLTGELIRGEDGNPVSVSSKFTPEESSGQVASRITANLREYGDREITVLESLYIIPKTGIPYLLLSNENAAAEGRTVFAGLTAVTVMDELYGTPVAGVHIRVVSQTDGFTFEGLSNEEGECSFPIGSGEGCLCTVISVPERYEPVEEALKFCSSDGEADQGFTVSLMKKNIIVLTRTDAETGLPVYGLTTAIKDSKGEQLTTIFSDEDGKARFDANALWDEAAQAAEAAGEKSFVLTLTFSDASTPSEYYPKEDSWTVSIDETGNITGTTELKSVKRQTLTISVVDGRGNGITDVQISLIGPDGSIQGRAVTDPDGNIYFTPKRTGEYQIFEYETPSGYIQSLKNNRFTVEKDGTVTGTVTITHLSEAFASSAAAVTVLTVVFAAIWLASGFFIKKAVRKKAEKLIDDITKTGRHSE